MITFLDVFAVSISLTIACLVCYYIGETLVFVTRSCWASFRGRRKTPVAQRPRPYVAIRQLRERR